MAFKGVRTLGLWTSLCVVLGLIMIGRVYIGIGSIDASGSHRLADTAQHQLLLTERIHTHAALLELSVLTEDWEMTRSATEHLSSDHRAWSDTQNTLGQSNGIGFRAIEGQESIGEHLDRVASQFSSINQAINELTLVGESILRRAPYIDQQATDRIASATASIEEHTPGYTAEMDEVAHLSALRADRSVSGAIARTRRTSLFIGCWLLLLVGTGFVPRIVRNCSTIRSLSERLARTEEREATRWTQMGSLGACFTAPIRVLKGSASSLSSGDPDPRATLEHARLIHGATEEIQVMIEDLLEFSAISSDTLCIQSETVDPRSVLSAIEQRFTPIAEARGLTLRVSIDESCPSLIQTDPVRLQQILIRIVENAIAFTQHGSVEVHAELKTRNDGDLLMIRVVDSGCGIHQDDMDLVFEPFERVDTAPNTPTHGVGLGLTVARSLAHHLGGELTIESALGAGSFVTVLIGIGNPVAQGVDPEILGEAGHENQESRDGALINAA